MTLRRFVNQRLLLPYRLLLRDDFGDVGFTQSNRRVAAGKVHAHAAIGPDARYLRFDADQIAFFDFSSHPFNLALGGAEAR